MGLMDRIKKVTGTNDSYDDSYEDDGQENQLHDMVTFLLTRWMFRNIVIV